MFKPIYKMNFQCPRCSKIFSTKQKLYNHIFKKKKRCLIAEGNIEKSNEQLKIELDNKFKTVYRQKRDIVTTSFNKCEALLTRENLKKLGIKIVQKKPTECFRIIKELFKLQPEIAFIKRDNNMSRVKIKIDKKWQSLQNSAVYNMIFMKFIDNSTTNCCHYRNFKYPCRLIEKYYDRASQFPNSKKVEEIQEYFSKIPKTKYIQKEKKPKKKVTYIEKPDIDFDEINYNNVIRALNKFLKQDSEYSEVDIANLINDQIVDNINKLRKRVQNYIDELEEDVQRRINDSYFSQYEENYREAY